MVFPIPNSIIYSLAAAASGRFLLYGAYSAFGWHSDGVRTRSDAFRRVRTRSDAFGHGVRTSANQFYPPPVGKEGEFECFNRPMSPIRYSRIAMQIFIKVGQVVLEI